MKFLQKRILGMRFIVIFLVIYWVAMFLGTHLSNPPPIATSLGDKSKHFGGYLGLTVLLHFALVVCVPKRRLVVIVCIVAIYGALDELTQALVPGRFADVKDYMADLCGLIVGLVLCRAFDLLTRKHAIIDKEDIVSDHGG